MNKIDIDVELLRLLPSTSEKGKILLEVLAERERGMATTQYHVAKDIFKAKGITFDKGDFNEIFGVLEQSGVGELESIGHRRAFRWRYNLVSAANVALGRKEAKDLIPRARSKISVLPKVNLPSFSISPSINDNKPALRHSRYQHPDSITIKRNGWEVDVLLKDLTNDRFGKIIRVLQNLSKAS